MINVEKVLAEVALAANKGPCEQHKTSEGKPGYLLDEMAAYTQNAPAGVGRGMHMLLSLTLELWRRNEYIFEALKQNLGQEAFLQVDAAYAARIKLHNDSLHAFEDAVPGRTNWEKRAGLADDIVHRMLQVTEQPHRDALALAIAKIDQAGVAAVTAREVAQIASLRDGAAGGTGGGAHDHGDHGAAAATGS